MRTPHRPRRPLRRRSVFEQLAAEAPACTFEIDLVDLMLDLDPGLLDRRWLDDLPR